MKITRTEAIRRIEAYKHQLIQRNQDMQSDYAEALATYMVLNGIKKPSLARMAVWNMGPDGLDALREQVNKLED